MISVTPKMCEKVARGDCTILVRKTRPKIETPFKCYIYQTKKFVPVDITDGVNKHRPFLRKNQAKVIGEFVCDGIEDFLVFENGSVQYWNFHELEKSCLTYNELSKYIGKNRKGYAWRISDVVIYDEPREIGEFKKAGFMTEEEWLFNLYPNTHCHYVAWAQRFNIEKPPKSWCLVEELKE